MSQMESYADELQSWLPLLEKRGQTDGLMRDLFEAVDYWSFLARAASAGDTKINYRERATGQLIWLGKLKDAMSKMTAEDRISLNPLIAKSSELLGALAATKLAPGGHQGLLHILKTRFHFLQSEYGFTVTKEEPMGMNLSSGCVWICLSYSPKSYLSFQFGQEPREKEFFGLEDLLFLYGDPRYRSVPEDLAFTITKDLEVWFGFIADVLRQYGDEILRNLPGAFVRLADAQSRRDAEHVMAMDVDSGQQRDK
jgi:hypothetical protein